jgi:muramoyltetrapeptide carboxypeptidase
MIIPPYLKAGDLIYITTPAKSIDKEAVMFAKNWLEKQGFSVLLAEHCLGKHNYFSGTDLERLQDFQFGINHPEVKAILCARGGYGCIRILDRINWAGMLREPKWICGFSDVTVFHHRLQRLGIASLHSTMPLNFNENSPESLQTFNNALTGEPLVIEAIHQDGNKFGEAKGEIIGGNLSIIYSLLGTTDAFSFKDKILFLEDLAEQWYHLDRMFFALQKRGALDQINGLVLGGFTDMKDTQDTFGMKLKEIVLQHFEYSKIPIAFDFPVGHISDNRTMKLGQSALLNVTGAKTSLSYV